MPAKGWNGGSKGSGKGGRKNYKPDFPKIEGEKKVVLNGYFKGQPEAKVTGTGSTIFNAMIGVPSKRETDDGEKWGLTSIKVVAFGRLAEKLAEQSEENAWIKVAGVWNNRSYDNKKGETVWITEVILRKFCWVDPDNNFEQTDKPVIVGGKKRSEPEDDGEVEVDPDDGWDD